MKVFLTNQPIKHIYIRIILRVQTSICLEITDVYSLDYHYKGLLNVYFKTIDFFFLIYINFSSTGI